MLNFANCTNLYSQTYFETSSGYIFSFYHNLMSPLRSTISECQFYPSCSHYSSEAINEYGVAKGIILTADRFIRCSGGTLNPNDYPRSNKKLIDKPTSNNIWGNKNLWKLTFNKSSSSDFKDKQETIHEANLENEKFFRDFDFCKLLFQENNFDNSIYELRKINFYANDTLTKNKANLLIAVNFLKMNKYSEARKIIDHTNKLFTNFDKLDKINLISQIDNLIVEYVINDLDNANSWNINKLNKINNKLELESLNKNDTLLNNFFILSNKLIAYSYFKIDDFNSSLKYLQTKNNSNLNPNNKISIQSFDKINDFMKKAQNTTGYSPELAGIFSAILPGSGYAYCGHYKEGLSALIINSLLGAGIYSQIKSKNIGTAVFTSLVTLPFYLGNVVGSYNTAENENLKTKQILLNDYRHLIGINIYFSDIYYLNLFDN